MGNLLTSIFLFLGSILGLKILYPNFVEPKTKSKAKSPNELYLQTQLKAFLNMFHDSSKEPNLNINKTGGEKEWERRKLFENTPVGNVLMWYDLYKQAFCYCSDVQITHPILNACAMKYTRLYFCRDYFVDTNILPDSFENPFNKQKDDEDKKEREQKKEKRKKLGIDFDPKAFVSSKQEPKISKEEPKTIYKNTFRYMGKLSSSQLFLQKPVEKPIEKEEDYCVIKKHTSYKDWKTNLRDFTCL